MSAGQACFSPLTFKTGRKSEWTTAVQGKFHRWFSAVPKIIGVFLLQDIAQIQIWNLLKKAAKKKKQKKKPSLIFKLLNCNIATIFFMLETLQSILYLFICKGMPFGSVEGQPLGKCCYAINIMATIDINGELKAAFFSLSRNKKGRKASNLTFLPNFCISPVREILQDPYLQATESRAGNLTLLLSGILFH